MTGILSHSQCVMLCQCSDDSVIKCPCVCPALDLATFDGGESRVSTLVAAANSPDNLCRMDPAWHPWM